MFPAVARKTTSRSLLGGCGLWNQVTLVRNTTTTTTTTPRNLWTVSRQHRSLLSVHYYPAASRINRAVCIPIKNRLVQCFSTTTTTTTSDNPSSNDEKPKNDDSSSDTTATPTSTTTNESKVVVDPLEGIEEIVEVDGKLLENFMDRTKFTVQVPVKMPDMGTDEKGYSKVAEWYYQPGDIIQRGNVLCDIETPGFTFGMETDDDELAILGEILVEQNVPVPDHTVICILYHEAKEDKSKKKEKPKESSSEE